MVQEYLRVIKQNEKRLAKAKTKLAVSIRNEVKNLMGIYSDTDFTFADIGFLYRFSNTLYILKKEGLYVSCSNQTIRRVNPDRVPFEKFNAKDLLLLFLDIGKATNLYNDLENNAMPIYRTGRHLLGKKL
jgi:hypothetical protein